MAFISSKSDIVSQIQSSLVSLFFSCVQDKTLIKLQFAETCAHSDYMNLSVSLSFPNLDEYSQSTLKFSIPKVGWI